MNKLLFGTAGIPISTTKPGIIEGIKRVNELDLDCMELEFVNRIFLNNKTAKIVQLAAKENKVCLTCHAPYYINLNSQEDAKIRASKLRIINSAKIAYKAGAWSLCFHAGFYLKQNPEKVYQKIKQNIEYITKTLNNENIDIWLRPETTGKPTQWGTLKEILKLSQEFEKVMPCIDFSHLHAREGKINTLTEFRNTLELVEKYLGKDGLKNMHAHISGIEYNEKGEKRHLPLDKSDFNYSSLLKSFKEFKVKGIIISESPLIEIDAIKMKKKYNKL